NGRALLSLHGQPPDALHLDGLGAARAGERLGIAIGPERGNASGAQFLRRRHRRQRELDPVAVAAMHEEADAVITGVLRQQRDERVEPLAVGLVVVRLVEDEAERRPAGWAARGWGLEAGGWRLGLSGG